MLFNISGTVSVLMHFPLHFSKTSLVKIDAFDKSLIGTGSSSLTSEGVICRFGSSVGGTLLWNLMVQPHAMKFLRRLEMLCPHV